MGSQLRVMIAVPCGWSVQSEFVKRLLQWMSGSKHQIAPMFELGATRLDMSLSAILVAAKQMGPDILLRLDSDIIPVPDIDTIISYVRQDFSRGYSCVFGPTRASNGKIMVMLREGGKETDLPQPNTCSDAHFGALCFSAMDSKLIEAYRPHVMETAINPSLGKWAGEEMRLSCMKWSEWEDLPAPEVGGGKDRLDSTIAAVDGGSIPLYVYNPPHTSEDADICRDLRINGFRLGVDPRLGHLHLKRIGLPSFGIGNDDQKMYNQMMGIGTPEGTA